MKKLILLATLPIILIGCHDSSAKSEAKIPDIIEVFDYCPRHIDNKGDREFTFQEEIDLNTDIFIGKVESVEMTMATKCNAIFSLDKSYKSSDNLTTKKVTAYYSIPHEVSGRNNFDPHEYASNPDNCPYRKGENYLVFGKKTRDNSTILSSPGCNSSGLIKDATKELHILNQKFKR